MLLRPNFSHFQPISTADLNVHDVSGRLLRSSVQMERRPHPVDVQTEVNVFEYCAFVKVFRLSSSIGFDKALESFI